MNLKPIFKNKKPPALAPLEIFNDPPIKLTNLDNFYGWSFACEDDL